MAAPSKRGLDYFPLSVHLLDEPKLRRPKMKYGYLAVVVFISLLGQLYRDKGYYLDYRDPDAVIWQVQSDLQGRFQPDYDTVAEVIGALVACGLFSDDLYQRGIITSKMAQETYYRATATRKTVDIDDSIWLLDMGDMEAISAKHCYYLKKLNELNNGVNQADNAVNETIYPQSKVKESKVNISNTPPTNKLDSRGVSGGVVDPDLAKMLSDITGRALTEYAIRRLSELVEAYGRERVVAAVRVAGDNGKGSIAYIEGVLKNAKQGRGANKQGTPDMGFGDTDYSKFI